METAHTSDDERTGDVLRSESVIAPPWGRSSRVFMEGERVTNAVIPAEITLLTDYPRQSPCQKAG